MGIIPEKAGGFGAVAPTEQVVARNELEPLQSRFEELKDWIGEEGVRFKEYDVGIAEGGGT